MGIEDFHGRRAVPADFFEENRVVLRYGEGLQRGKIKKTPVIPRYGHAPGPGVSERRGAGIGIAHPENADKAVTIPAGKGKAEQFEGQGSAADDGDCYRKRDFLHGRGS